MRVQCNKSKLWNIKGTVKDVRVNEAGKIVLYLNQLENGHVTSRHRQF